MSTEPSVMRSRCLPRMTVNVLRFCITRTPKPFRLVSHTVSGLPEYVRVCKVRSVSDVFILSLFCLRNDKCSSVTACHSYRKNISKSRCWRAACAACSIKKQFRKPVLYPAELPRRESADSTGLRRGEACRLIFGAFHIACVIRVHNNACAHIDMGRHHGAHAIGKHGRLE